MESASVSEKLLHEILPILKRGNVVEIKQVRNEIQIIEIERKTKHRVTITTG